MNLISMLLLQMAVLLQVMYCKSVRHSATIQKTSVKLPSGKFYLIADPNVSDEAQCGDDAELAEVSTTRKEYSVIVSALKGTTGDNTVTVEKVQKILNGCVWNRYKLQRDAVQQEAGAANECLLFHGGGQETMDIVDNGFNENHKYNSSGVLALHFRSVAWQANALALPQDNNTRALLLCRVTTGNVYTVNQWTPLTALPEDYQSAKMPGGKSYLLFNGEQVYPEYLITYRLAV